MGYMNKNLVYFADCSSLSLPNLAPNTYGIMSTVTNSNLVASTDIVNGIGGGKGIEFNGGNQRLAVAYHANMNISDAITCFAFVKPGATSAAYGRYFCRSNAYLIGQQNNDETDVRWECVSGDVLNSGAGTVTVDAWNCIAGTFDTNIASDNKKIFINGDEIASKTVAGTITTNTNDLNIGNLIAGQWYQGVLDYIMIFNIALTKTQLIDLEHLCRTGRI